MFRKPYCWLLLLILSGVIFPARIASARDGDAEVSQSTDAASGFEVWTIKSGRTELKFAPAAGANPYSLKFEGRELLRTPKSLKELPGFGYGNPLLYPTPNRVRDAKFTFDGKTFQFPANNKSNFLHGLVHSAPWKVTGNVRTTDGIGKVCSLQFAPGTEHYRLFPFKHDLTMAYQVTDGKVKLSYHVINTGDKPLPFGFAFHPWFLYLGERSNTYLTIPATHHMHAVEQLPSGKLEDLTGSPFDARKPLSLKGFVIDDVYFGMSPNKPVVIDHRDARLRLSLQGSADFTHLVVYTPDAEWFCVENQTCSTDAHNLHAKGLVKESHLQIVEPGKHLGGSVEIRIEKY